MGTAIFGIAVSGLNAAMSSLETASNNISNVNTDGYHRQVTGQDERQPFFEGFGFIGRGVDTSQVNRVYDKYLDTQVTNTVSASSFYQTQGELMSRLDNMVGSSTNGLSPSMQTFFTSLQTMSSTPTSIPARQTVINNAQALVGQVRDMSSQLSQIRTDLNGQIQSSVDSINSYASQIASLNTQILALSQGGNRLPNDVLDQRDQAVQKLAELVAVSTVTQADGTYSVFIGNGQSLVRGGITSTLQTVPSPADPQQLAVAYNTNGVQTLIPETMLTGGQLGGALNFRSSVLDRADADLGRLAISIADAMNRQYRLGRDLNNNPVTTDITDPTQGTLFTNFGEPGTASSAGSGLLAQLYPAPPAAAPTVQQQVALLRQASFQFSLLVNDPAALTTASSLKANAALGGTVGANNTGTLAVDLTATPPIQSVAGVLSGAVTLTYNGGAYTATNGFNVAVAGSVLTLTNTSGVTVQLNTTGTPNTGDILTIGPANTSQAYVSSVWQVAGQSPAPLGPLNTPPALTLTYNSVTQSFSATGPSAGGYTVTVSPTVAGGFLVTDNTAANGVSIMFQMSGNPANGDQFVIDQKKVGPASADNSATDNSNLRAMTTLQTQNTITNTPSGGSNYLPALGSPANATFQSFFSQAVSYIGSTANTVLSAADSQLTALNQVKQVQQSFSGVNLDEEAANLIKFQQAYQASSKVIQMAQEMFNSLLQL
jgi:flagellar hook-associated protein 1 FlgK